ncbi:MAG: hypothetical protein PUI52_07465 [Bacteroidales bacterium]|nr:hypothetical protein [Bacteroidales bacterium]MDY6170049.1 hypothetical protein [Candidatus Cryptobacteroides sp.]
MKAQEYTSPDFMIVTSVMVGCSGFAASKSVEEPATNESYTVDNTDVTWI